MESVKRASESASIPLSPFCCEIRSKKTYTLDAIPMSENDILDASRNCWCRLTMQPIGADGEFVQPRDCKPGRGCYKSHFAE